MGLFWVDLMGAEWIYNGCRMGAERVQNGCRLGVKWVHNGCFIPGVNLGTPSIRGCWQQLVYT